MTRTKILVRAFCILLVLCLVAPINAESKPISLSLSGPLMNAAYRVVPGQILSWDRLTLTNTGTEPANFSTASKQVEGIVHSVSVTIQKDLGQIQPGEHIDIYPKLEVNESALGLIVLHIAVTCRGIPGVNQSAVSASAVSVVQLLVLEEAVWLFLTVKNQRDEPVVSQDIEIVLKNKSQIYYKATTDQNGTKAIGVANGHYRLQLFIHTPSTLLLKEQDIVLDANRTLVLWVTIPGLDPESAPTFDIIPLLALLAGLLIGAEGRLWLFKRKSKAMKNAFALSCYIRDELATGIKSKLAYLQDATGQTTVNIIFDIVESFLGTVEIPDLTEEIAELIGD